MFLVRSLCLCGWFVLALVLSGCGAQKEHIRKKPEQEYVLVPGKNHPIVSLTSSEFDALGLRSLSSSYFDRGMGYENSRFEAISFSSLLEKYPAMGADAVLLDCFDDYQGMLSVKDITNYDLHLATAIHLAPDTVPPAWLKPLLVVVPDGVDAPFQERFMTANIRGLHFVQLAEYYQPLIGATRDNPQAQAGFDVYRDNCLFCHAIKNIGGNKGGALGMRFDWSKASEVGKFINTFFAFHHKDNPDKQNLEQFVTRGKLLAVAEFLKQAVEP